MFLDPYFKSLLDTEPGLDKRSEEYKRLSIILERFDPSLTDFQKIHVYNTIRFVLKKAPDIIRLAYKALQIQEGDTIVPGRFGFLNTPHMPVNLYHTDLKAFKKRAMYELGFRLLQCVYNLYNRHATDDVFQFMTHVNTTVLRAYQVMLSWNEKPITDDVSLALNQFIAMLFGEGFKVYEDLYTLKTFDQLQVVCSVYRALYLSKYGSDDDTLIAETIYHLENLSNRNDGIVPLELIDNVGWQLANDYGIDSLKYNPRRP